MDKLMIRIHNTETDEIIDREMTAQEKTTYLTAIQQTQEQDSAKEAAKASALAKLAALGLSADEIAAL